MQLCIGATAGLSIVGKSLCPHDDDGEADGPRWHNGGRNTPLVSLVDHHAADFPSQSTRLASPWSTCADRVIQILHSYTFVYAAACASTKVSILCFYIRIFTPLDRYSRYAIAFGFFLTISYPIVVWVTMGNCCRPISFYWNQFIGAKGTCIDVNTFFLALGIVNMLNDFIVLLIPIPRILKLQMTNRKKLAISAIMAVGIL